MSVIGSTELGWLLDHKKYIENTYKELLECIPSRDSEAPPQMTTNLNAHLDMFSIHLPFMMDSQFEAHVRETKLRKSGAEDLSTRRKRKRKRTNEDDTGTAYHANLVSILSKALEQLKDLGKKISHFTEFDEEDRLQLDNNIKPRALATHLDRDTTFPELIDENRRSSCQELDLQGRCDLKLDDLLGVFGINSADTASIIPLSGQKYILPPHCSFLLSDVSNYHLLPPGAQYDLIVMDPPWENKSVKRKKSYKMVRDSELEDIPIGQLAADGCLVVTWVTNKQQQQRLVKETLFPKWGITPLATWYWLKVTTEGEAVYPMRDQHSKKPYEALILGCKSLSAPQTLPDQKVLLSVPSCIHSHKPPLQDILKDFLQTSTPRCLEIFARSLQPGWTSWGNEVIKLQREDLFTRIIK